jgi:hypothetical protein
MPRAQIAASGAQPPIAAVSMIGELVTGTPKPVRS